MICVRITRLSSEIEFQLALKKLFLIYWVHRLRELVCTLTRIDDSCCDYNPNSQHQFHKVYLLDSNADANKNNKRLRNEKKCEHFYCETNFLVRSGELLFKTFARSRNGKNYQNVDRK